MSGSEATPCIIERADPAGEEARGCVERYYADMSARLGIPIRLEDYPSLPPEEFTPPRGVFLIARRGGVSVGCGALATHALRIGYLSRMWVDETARGIGLGRHLLSTLEEWAARLGHERVRLYTHGDLAEAQGLYRATGYREVEPFLEDAPFADVWFEREL